MTTAIHNVSPSNDNHSQRLAKAIGEAVAAEVRSSIGNVSDGRRKTYEALKKIVEEMEADLEQGRVGDDKVINRKASVSDAFKLPKGD